MRQFAICLTLLMVACAKQPIHVGAVNQFDSQAYDALITVQAALETASKQVVNYPDVKPALNKAIDGYNAAMVAYKAYHEAAAAGKPTDAAGLDARIKSLTAAVAQILGQLKPKPVAMLEWRYA